MRRVVGRRRALPVIVVSLLGLILMVATLRLQAQGPARWSQPELVYETMNSIDAPSLAADVAGVVHLVWREYPPETDIVQGELETIYYASDMGGNWGQAWDIIAMSEVVGPTIATDSNGLIHLLWSGPNSTLYYSLAGVQSATTAQGWVEPVAIATANQNAQIVVGPDDRVHIVYPGTFSSGVYYIYYDADRDAWSSPVNISPTTGASVSADYTRLAVGRDGALHAIWTEFELPDGWPPTGVYYSRSTDIGETWSRPIELAGPSYDQGVVAIDSAGQVHVSWNGVVGVGGRYHRWSDDGGLSWSSTSAPVEVGQGGTEGPPQLVVDSGGTLHMLTTFNGCAYYLFWVDGVWSQPECISGATAMASGWIEQPALTITNGNMIHAVFWDERARLWHTSLDTGTPPLIEFRPVAEVVETPTSVTETAIEIPVATASPNLDLSDLAPAATDGFRTPGRSLLLAAVAASTVLLLVLLVKMIRSR